MTAVLRHELSSYFTNVTGYVFGAFLLLFAGIYTMVINLQSLWKLFGIRIRHHALESQNPATMGR